MSKLANALFSKTQQKLLGLLYSQPDKSFYTKQILRLTGMGVAHVKRELDSMVSADIFSMEKIGNQHHYQANPDCQIYSELQGIVNKTIGVAEVISQVLSALESKVDWAFVFGSVASGKESASSDIDLMVIGDIEFSEVVSLLYTAQEQLGREINPKIYKKDEWTQMLNKENAFVREVLSKPRIDIIGSENEYG